MRPGLFLSFEGGEGSGKSVQARALATHLQGRGLSVVVAHEPGSTPLGERVRELLLFSRDVPLTPEAQALLFSAARAELVRTVIHPSLRDGKCVIVDRFFDSTLAYQGYGHGADLADLRAVTRVAVGDLVPELTFLLDLPVDVGILRSRGRSDRWDRFESGEREFHRRVREGYLALAREEPRRWVVISSDRGEAEIAAEIAGRVDRALLERATRTIPASP